MRARRLIVVLALISFGLVGVVSKPALAVAPDAAPVAAGVYHSCAVTAAGGVACWGANDEGELGDGTLTTRRAPVGVIGLSTGVVAVATGRLHSCALTAAGGVKCWGANSLGQLGDGTTTAHLTPVSVSGLTTGVAAISTGSLHSCAVMVSGAAKCWGSNEHGQLGDGTTVDGLTPVTVSGLTSGVVAIAAGAGGLVLNGDDNVVSDGGSYSCAVTTGGAVKCWGYNNYGELGDGTHVQRLTPTSVSGLASGVTAISGGLDFPCVLLTSGTVKCWGRNNEGNLGDGTSVNRSAPVAVSGLTGVAEISAGYQHACARLTVGTVKCWGGNELGQLGDGTFTNRATPVAVSGLGSGVLAVSAGSVHTCALTPGGVVRCWGYDSDGELGIGETYFRAAPADVPALASGVVTVALDGDPTCALTTGGGLKCWGGNYQDPATPTDVPGFTSGVAAIDVSAKDCLVTTAGGAKCWNGDPDHPFEFVDVPGLTSGVVAVAGGSDGHNCALTSGGAVECWGRNDSGQVGNGTTEYQPTPVPVSGLGSGVAAISLSNTYSCALTTSGAAKCWGYNVNGEMGDGTTTDRHTPVGVSGLTSGVAAISAGDAHACAVLTSGGVKCWGAGTDGQLGDGTTTKRLTPVAVVGLGSGVADVSAGTHQSTCALLTSGGVDCWGNNEHGALGDGTVTRRLTPVAVAGLSSGIDSVAVGLAGACAVTTGGAVKCWGDDTFGELGTGTTSLHSVPVATIGDFYPVRPTVTIASPASGAFYGLNEVANASYTCGPGAVSCVGGAGNGAPFDTSAPGGHVFSVDATESSGRVTTVTRSYTVDASAPTVTVESPVDGAYFVVGQAVNASYACADDVGGSGIASCSGAVADGAAINTSVGTHVFAVNATDNVGNVASASHSYTVVEPQTVSEDLPPEGGSVSTDPGGVGPTSDDPVATRVSSPNGGTVSITEGAVSQGTPSGFGLLGLQMNIVAPPASAEAPLTLVFDVDAAMLPAGETKDTLSLLKDAALLPDCPGATTVPDGVSACVSGRDDAPSGGGDVRLTVISVSASMWNVAVGTPTPPNVSIANVQAAEGHTGSSVVNVPVTLSQSSALPVSVHYATANGTATAGSDYTSAAGTLTFAPGERTQLVPVSVSGDRTSESDEVFTVSLSSPSGAAITAGVATATIVNDDLTAPASVGAAPGNAQATVTWSPPAVDGGSAVTSYKVTPYSGATALPALAKTFGAAVRTGSMTGLSNGTTYTFKVAATNGFGMGPLATSPAIKVGSPVAPTGVKAASGSTATATGSLIVSFVIGANNGSGITSQTASCVSSNGGVTKTGVHSGATAAPITVAGTTTGKTYTCTVGATNARGAGPTSLASSPVIVGSPASAAGVVAKSGSTMTATGPLVVTFANDANNGSGITSQTATCVSSNGGVTKTGVHAGSAAAPITVAATTTGKSYTCTVKVNNGRGAGLASAPSQPVVMGSPAPPTGVSAVKVATSQIRVTFTGGVNNGSATSSYTATCTSTNGGVAGSKAGAAGPLTVTGLSAGKTYTCTAKGTNARGAGLASASSAAVTT